VGRVDALVVVLNQVPLRKTEPIRIEPNRVNVRHLYVKTNFSYLIHALAIVQHRAQKLGPNAPPSIPRQHSERHDVKPLILAVIRLDSRANCAYKHTLKVSKLVQVGIACLHEILIESFVVHDRK
jgi:hypothetical protein